MAENLIGSGNGPRPGRPKGSVNKVGAAAKEVIQQAATNIGGTLRLTDWIKEDPANEKAFWTTIYPKLIPVQLGGDPDSPLLHEIRRTIVRP